MFCIQNSASTFNNFVHVCLCPQKLLKLTHKLNNKNSLCCYIIVCLNKTCCVCNFMNFLFFINLDISEQVVSNGVNRFSFFINLDISEQVVSNGVYRFSFFINLDISERVVSFQLLIDLIEFWNLPKLLYYIIWHFLL